MAGNLNDIPPQNPKKVAIFGRRKHKLDEVAAEITAAGGIALAVSGDVGVPEDLERAIQQVVAEFGALHYGVNNAGMSGYFENVADLSIEKWNRVIGVNLSGLFYSMKYQIPAILAAGGGAIVNVSSVYADRGGPSTDYSSAKHATRGLTRTVAKEYGAKGIRINELQPGVIDTEMTRDNTGRELEGRADFIESDVPLKRVGTGREIATAIAFLLSDEASYITGTHLAVDGGFLA